MLILLHERLKFNLFSIFRNFHESHLKKIEIFSFGIFRKATTQKRSELSEGWASTKLIVACETSSWCYRKNVFNWKCRNCKTLVFCYAIASQTNDLFWYFKRHIWEDWKLSKNFEELWNCELNFFNSESKKSLKSLNFSIKKPWNLLNYHNILTHYCTTRPTTMFQAHNNKTIIKIAWGERRAMKKKKIFINL